MKFIDIFHQHVSQQPEHEALVDAAGTLTYAQLNTEAELLAQKYASQGIGVGDAVGVRVPYGKDIMVHAIALFKLGAVYVPIDDSYPEDRVRYMIEDCGREKHDSDVAVILYTSGTTGRPKGVVHTQKSLLAMQKWQCEYAPVPMSRQTRCGIISGFSFVATTNMLFSTIAAGGTLYFASHDERVDMTLLYKFIQRNAITHIFMSASLGMAMVETYDTNGTLIMVGGEKLRRFTPVAGQSLVNVYGSTEGAPICTSVIRGDERDITIGRPYEGITARIVDPSTGSGQALQDVAPGEVGELIYSSDIMAAGYLHLPEQTEKKWEYIDGVRYYHTGDRMRQDAEGKLYCLGRTDNMVKIRGLRVETGEVERQISLAVPETELAVVVRTVHGIEHLVCFYQSDKEVDAAAVEKEISKYLAEYMIPDVWVRMDRFPRNSNGKIVRSELPTPSLNTDKLSVVYNEVEMRVVLAANMIVGNALSLDDNFFECGGTSLGAIKLASQLRTMGINVTGSMIMQHKVLRLVAAQADVDYEQLWTPEQYKDITDSFAQRGETIEKVLPLSNEQEDALIRYMMHPDSHTHRNVFILGMDSHINPEVLRDAIDSAAREYDVLRSSAVIHHHFPFQQVITDRRLTLDIFDMPTDKPMMAGVRDIYQHLMHEPYDPECSQLVSFGYTETQDGKSFVFVVVNNITISKSIARKAILHVVNRLAEKYPDDASISGWRELMELSVDVESSSTSDSSAKTKMPVLSIAEGLEQMQKTMAGGLIRTYSPQREGVASVVFVHTGNTGSDAYYRLADRIGEKCAFAVIEPYNLFHQNDIQHGIKAIAKKYVEILRNYQPEGPYILGGWCYGGVVAHEMACQLQKQGEEVRHLFMFDSHALAQGNQLVSMAKNMFGTINRKYFEECPLFEDLRGQGLLEAMVRNSTQVSYDLANHVPSHFDGSTTYFKPMEIPAAATGKAREYWEEMMKFDAGNYENYCNRKKLQIINTPHEHDLMMDDESLAITVPVINKVIRL